jgi:hypothetical protein
VLVYVEQGRWRHSAVLKLAEVQYELWLSRAATLRGGPARQQAMLDFMLI